jgi:hypothetical protein
VFRPDVPAPPPAADLALWTDYRTDRHGIVRDGKGGLWMFLADRPGQASRWDGNAWGHVKVPFDTKKASRCLGDDRGHLLVEVEGDDAGAYDVAPDGVRRQAAFPAVLAAAVKAGVRQFEPSPDYAGCAVTDGGEIWFGAANDKVVHHYDGRAWSEAAVGIAPGGIVLSPRHGVLIADHAYKLGFYILRDGHLESIAELNRKAARGMLGPWGLQPFEESLLDRRPDAYVPIDFAGRWELYPLVRIREDGRTYSTRGDPWTSYWSRIIPAAGGVGFWSSKDPGGSMPLRLVSGVEFPCDFVRTPLDGETVCQAMDDPAHNVWFTTVESAEVRHVWVKRLDGFRIKVAEMPAESERQLKVQAEAVLPGLRADRLGLLWRVDDGPWRRGFPGGEATVLFAASGPHDVQIMGVDPTGGTTPERATRRVTATVALPKILAMMPGPVTVEDVVWTPPVWARPSAPSEIAVVAYRTGDEEWQDSPDGRISMTRFQPGTFDMDLTARESRFFRDPVPVRMTVTYAPDARLIVEKRMEALAGADAHVSWVTREELLKVGPLIVPIVREKLGAGVENRQVREAFEAILAKYDKAAPSEKSGGK